MDYGCKHRDFRLIIGAGGFGKWQCCSPKKNKAPATKGAPGKYTGAASLLKYEKRLVINGGPTIDVALIKLVKAPCNSPCSLAGT